jgi:peptidoglycan-N-acetylmuramic acid deacetylase
MNKKKIEKLTTFFMLSLVFIFSFSVLSMKESGNISNKEKNEINLVQTSATSSISNKKISWGIKRGKNHDQPDLGNENKRIINRYNGICIGNSEKKYIYLTFDCGYEAGYTEKILEILKQNDVKATFFITGHYLNTASDTVKKMIDEGHIVGNHTSDHICMPESSNEEIKDDVMELHTAVYDKFGYEMKYIRPPKGEYSERSIEYTNTLGYTTVMWSFAYDDWDENKQGREEYGKEKIMENLHNGEVMLLHSTSKDNSNILDECIKKIKDMGYEFKTLDEFEK